MFCVAFFSRGWGWIWVYSEWKTPTKCQKKGSSNILTILKYLDYTNTRPKFALQSSQFWQTYKLPFQHHKRSMFCMQAFVFDWFDIRIMLTFSIPSADWNGLFVPLDSLSHTQLHLSCKSIPAAPRSDEEKRAVGRQWSSSQRTSGEAVP